MQQTKRRSKKGVILLALTIALLVLAFAPSAMAAPMSLTINNGATVIGNTHVTLQFNSDDVDLGITQYSLQDAYGAGLFVPASPVLVPYAGGTMIDRDYTMVSSATPAVGQTFTVRVLFYNAAGTVINGISIPVIFDNRKTVSELDWNGYGALGDYATRWFGPVAPNTPVRADLFTSGADPHSIVWKIDSGAWQELLFPWVNPVSFGTTFADGKHTIAHYGVAADTLITDGAVTFSEFGWDSTPPVVTFSEGPNTTTWYGNKTIPWKAQVTDGTGSGVAPTPIFSYIPGGSLLATPLPWSIYRYEASGDVPIGSNVTVAALDMVGNSLETTITLKWDLVAPHTSYTVDPVGADTISGWTNKDVTVTFHAMDPGAPTTGSGVAYTEYIEGNATSTAPAQSASGKQLTVAADGTSSMTVTETAPSGPRVVWFRSVDKATPANMEVWQRVFIFIDKKAPVLSNDAPSWWINSPANFSVTLEGSDPNSGILQPPGIQYAIPGWHPPVPWTSGTAVPFSLNPATHFTDGFYTFQYRATDLAGNKAEATQTVGIDTRAPVTDGAMGWINGTKPYVLTATDQVIGAGTSATMYRTDQATPWSVNVAATVATQLMTDIPAFAQVQGAIHTIDFASFDAALPFGFNPKTAPLPSWHSGNFEGTSYVWTGSGTNLIYTAVFGYKTRTVQLDITAPAVTAMDPKNGNWQMGPGVVNFSGTDVGAGYAYTEWSTDGGTTWTKGEVASVGGNGEITVTYHGVDKVGLKSADQTIMVMVASTGPSVVGANASAKKGHKATFNFNVTSVTPQVRVVIQIRTKSGRTVSTHNYANVTANSDQSRSFKVNYPKGKYNIRISAVDQAGNNQTMRGTGTLTVK